MNLKKRYVPLLAGICIGLLSANGVFFFYGPQLLRIMHSEEDPSISGKVYKVAFHTVAEVRAIKELISTTLKFCRSQGVRIEPKIFYYQNDLSLLKAQIEEGIAWNAQAIVSVGTRPAQNVRSLLEKRQCTIPHIFTCALIPTPPSEGRPRFTGTTSTGWVETSIKEREGAALEAFLKIRPDAKNILIFYSVTAPEFEEAVKEATKTLGMHNITVRGIPVSNPDEVTRCAQEYITPKTDAVIILRDMLVVNCLQHILTCCRHSGSTCFVADSRSVKDGAVAGYCVEESELGILTGEMLLKVLEERIPVETIPITYLDTTNLCRICINLKEMKNQGLKRERVCELINGKTKVEFI